jgi:serine/threonine protein kinase
MPSDLRKLINDRTKTKNSTRPFSEQEAKSLITQIAAGMAFLHGRHVFHRDLKARNVLVHEHPDSLHAKIFMLHHLLRVWALAIGGHLKFLELCETIGNLSTQPKQMFIALQWFVMKSFQETSHSKTISLHSLIS